MRHYLTIPRVCEQCGTPFMAEAHQVNIGKARFCGKRCANRANAVPTPPIDRFWRFVNKTESCWLWTGAPDRKGYGRFDHQLAHRYSWQLAHGAIPEGLNVLHNCPGGDTPACVNPAHLWLGTILENNADMVEKGRAARGAACRRSTFTDDDIRVIRVLYATGAISQRQISRDYGVSQSVISEIIARKTWAHVA